MEVVTPRPALRARPSTRGFRTGLGLSTPAVLLRVGLVLGALALTFGARAQTVPIGSSSPGAGVVGGGSTVVSGGDGEAPSGPAGGALNGTYPNPGLATGAVTSTKILDGTIIVDDLADDAVTSAKILDGTVAASDIAANTITAGKLATGAVTSTVILDATILAADFAAGAVDTAAILDATILAADLAAGAVTSAKILDGTIVVDDLADGAVTTAKILDGTIAAADLASDSVTTAKILDGTITSSDLNSAAVTSTQIVGPASAVDDECVRFDGTTGKLAQAGSGNCTISDAGLVTSVGLTTTGAITISGVSADITTVSNQDLTLAPHGTGSVVLQSGDEVTQIVDSAGGVDITFTTSTATARGILTIGNTGAMGSSGNDVMHVGTSANKAATALAAALSDSVAGASNTDLFQVFGEGMVSVGVQQAASCAAGVLALDPTSSVVYLNANSAACAVTLGESNAKVGSDVTIILTANVSGAVTFPNVTNVHAGPTACTTTGLSTIGSSYRIHYAGTLNEYVGVACTNN